MSFIELRKYETGTWGDCYHIVGEIKIISVSKNDISLMVDDECCGVLDFPFETIKTSQEMYNSLEKAARNRDIDAARSVLERIEPNPHTRDNSSTNSQNL